jgi:UDP-N-acetylglucosamine 1-carboxyvinyltransferase
MGAKITLDGGIYRGSVDRLRGANIYLDSPSAGATQHLMTTACLAEGVTVIQNAAMEPEVTTLARFLGQMGARIEGAGTSSITIYGRRQVGGADFVIPADRMQAGTYLLAGAITRGSVRVNGILPDEHTAVVNKLIECGADVEQGYDWIRASASERLNGTRVKTMPHPGFPTDMQQPMAALLATAKGPSVVEETIYESRTGHVNELVRMGADLRIEGRSVVINGVERLRGAGVVASDLRAGAALCLAGMAADGETHIRNIEMIDRGYHCFEETLRSLGANIERVPNEVRQLAQ